MRKVENITRAEKSLQIRKLFWKEADCKACKKKFQPTNFGQKYCSFACIPPKKIEINRTRIPLTKQIVRRRICENCGKEFYRYRTQEYWRGKGKFCSKKCQFKRGLATVGSVDAVWAKAIKTRAGNKCEYCGRIDTLNSHHIFSRSNRVTRWDMDNGVCLCVAHHLFGNFSAHKAPIEFIEWLKEKRGEEWYKRLRAKAFDTSIKVEKEEYRKVKEYLELFI